MELWLFGVRIPAYRPKPFPPRATIEDVERVLAASPAPPEIGYPAANYNHLMEQPTQFFATALALNALGVKDAGVVGLAWAYVGLRVAHSFVQVSGIAVVVRFQVFAASSVVLLAMTGVAVVRFGRLVWGENVAGAWGMVIA